MKKQNYIFFCGKEFRFRDPKDYHEGRPNVIHYKCSTKAHNRKIDILIDIECVKERFKKSRMYFQAMKSYCKNNNEEVLSILQKCINIKKLKELKYDRRRFPHLDEYWTYRGQDYYMRDTISELIEIYIDILIKKIL